MWRPGPTHHPIPGIAAAYPETKKNKSQPCGRALALRGKNKGSRSSKSIVVTAQIVCLLSRRTMGVLLEMKCSRSAKKEVSQERSWQSGGQQPDRLHSQSYRRMTKQNSQSKSRSLSSSIQEDSSSEKSYDSGSIIGEA
uniref:Uncharacterized protein n=1 Tax=Ditylenchus dipsaci TaxID=166011 RepID=A0A915EWL9_9BILA